MKLRSGLVVSSATAKLAEHKRNMDLLKSAAERSSSLVPSRTDTNSSGKAIGDNITSHGGSDQTTKNPETLIPGNLDIQSFSAVVLKDIGECGSQGVKSCSGDDLDASPSTVLNPAIIKDNCEKKKDDKKDCGKEDEIHEKRGVEESNLGRYAMHPFASPPDVSNVSPTNKLPEREVRLPFDPDIQILDDIQTAAPQSSTKNDRTTKSRKRLRSIEIEMSPPKNVLKSILWSSEKSKKPRGQAHHVRFRMEALVRDISPRPQKIEGVVKMPL